MAVPGIETGRSLALHWLKSQQNVAWGWGEHTQRAIVALYLANGVNFNGTNKDEDLAAKHLELQMAIAILRNGTDEITPTQLSMYINALLVICHDPRNFYGFNLLKDLKTQVEDSSHYIHPLPYLTLCIAKELPSEAAVSKVLDSLESTSNHSFLIDVQAVALMALACISKETKYSYLQPNVTKAAEGFKKQQMEDGSFGSKYSTALIIQALLANGHEEDKDWNLRAAMDFLKKQQTTLGSFGDFLATYLILPLLNAKSLVDIGKVKCTENIRMPKNGNPQSDIKYRLGPKISVEYSLYVGDNKDQIHPILLRVPANITVLDVMSLAAEIDPKYKYEARKIVDKMYIYELSGIANDPEDGKFWLLHTSFGNTSAVIISESPDVVTVKDNEHIIMWYKTADIW